MAHTTENTTGYYTFTATAVAIGLGVRVKWDGTNILAAGATDSWIGVTTAPIVASGNGVIKLRNTPGSFMVQSGGAITAGNRLYAAASGMVDDAQTSGSFTGLVAKTGAGGSGEIIEAIPSTDTAAIGFMYFPVTLAGVTAADVVTNVPLTFAGTIVSFDFITGVPVTTGSKLATFNMEINTTNVTGGTIALTSALATPLGAVVSSSAITAANTFASGDTFSIEAASVTAFAEGTGVFQVGYVRN
jgi:hypothetical protein